MNNAIAQVNAAVMRGALGDPVMKSMVSKIDSINRLAEQHHGFIWRIEDIPPGTLAPIQVYLGLRNDDRIFFNLTMWESIDSLKQFTYETAHNGLLKDKNQWVPSTQLPTYALWWIDRQERPRIEEAARRLATLRDLGPTQTAFTFKAPHPAPSPAN